MRYALFDHVGGDHLLLPDFVSVLGLDDLQLAFVLGERICMYRRLYSHKLIVLLGLPLSDVARRDVTCGTRPFGIGRFRMPETKLVHPSRKKSQ